MNHGWKAAWSELSKKLDEAALREGRASPSVVLRYKLELANRKSIKHKKPKRVARIAKKKRLTQNQHIPIGSRYTMLTVVGECPEPLGKKKIKGLLCLCSCGRHVKTTPKSLLRGRIKQCVECRRIRGTQGNWYRSTYLNSPHWINLRASKLRANPFCQRCGARYDLNIHHVRYLHIFDVTVDDLLTLCRRCHEAEHKIHPKTA